jgi:hypothetical protein
MSGGVAEGQVRRQQSRGGHVPSSYRSSNLKVASTKTLVLVKTGDRWLIQQERVGS